MTAAKTLCAPLPSTEACLFARWARAGPRESAHIAGGAPQRHAAGSRTQHASSQAQGMLHRRRCDARRTPPAQDSGDVVVLPEPRPPEVEAALEVVKRTAQQRMPHSNHEVRGACLPDAAQQVRGARGVLAGRACVPRRLGGVYTVRADPTLLLHVPFRDRAMRASSGTLPRGGRAGCAVLRARGTVAADPPVTTVRFPLEGFQHGWRGRRCGRGWDVKTT
jgi:hypothetical protein